MGSVTLFTITFPCWFWPLPHFPGYNVLITHLIYYCLVADFLCTDAPVVANVPIVASSQPIVANALQPPSSSNLVIKQQNLCKLHICHGNMMTYGSIWWWSCT
jgi:hypothetical protein